MRMLTTKEWEEAQSYRERLIEALQLLEDNWRAILTVDHEQIEDQLKFEREWENEHPASYGRWRILRKGLGLNQYCTDTKDD